MLVARPARFRNPRDLLPSRVDGRRRLSHQELGATAGLVIHRRNELEPEPPMEIGRLEAVGTGNDPGAASATRAAPGYFGGSDRV
jgi:hypothetical protein